MNNLQRIIDELLQNAQTNYAINETEKTIGELFDELNNPDFINSKDFALGVCNALITILIKKSDMREGSILHLLGLRLMDYIKKTSP
ncbi:MAG: hypothetical protein LBB81_08495 [Treponema sp.]|jgi:hypothetical protein|nr:hypothetical protein [Treponema sp.]